MKKEEKKQTVWYLCDGEKADCKKVHCYKNTDDNPCRHTKDIGHALNFEKKEYGSHVSYQEIRRGSNNTAAEQGS